MKRIVITLFLLTLFTASIAQVKYYSREVINRKADSITNEGKMLYRSEWTSWYGTDVFLEKFKNKQSLIGGYISYETPAGSNNVFFSKGDDPDVFVTISFGKEQNSAAYTLDTSARKLNANEKDLFIIRRAALNAINSDTTFKRYQNTGINIIPTINNGVKRVYVLTSPTVNGTIIIGNDYLIDFNNKNEITNIKKIHNSLISNKQPEGSVGGYGLMHTHLVGKDEFMSATDICTLMLYENQTPVTQCYVISKDYVSIWDCKKHVLVVLTQDAWDKINKDQHSKN